MFKIGFATKTAENPGEESTSAVLAPKVNPVRSVVRVFFPASNTTLSYYNDAFDLKIGDIVFVDGKLEGERGRVAEVHYNFKIKPSEYKRVISVADTRVKGEFFFAGSHLIAFDPSALPYERVITWFKAPEKDGDEYIVGTDGTSFRLDDLTTMDVTRAVAERGEEYYGENKVCYICLDGIRGRAIVEGSTPYELEFEYQENEVRNLVCNCPCGCTCKHEFAAMLQLRETLGAIIKNYAAHYDQTGYFATISKNVLFNFAVDTNEVGSLIL